MSDNQLMFNCDKVNWYIYEGRADDICTLDSVDNYIKPALTKTGMLKAYVVYDGVGHRLKEFEPKIHDLFPPMF